MKKCCKCKVMKEFSEFGKHTKSPDGLKYECKQCRKEYNQRTREQKKEYNQQYYNQKKEDVLKTNKEYRLKNADKISIQRKEYREKNKEYIRQQNAKYRQRRNELIKERRKYDIEFKITENLRTKIHNVLSNKNRPSSEKLIGCNRTILIEFLEFQFDENMNWNNYGKEWHIDHVLPINKFNLINENEQKICFNWKNLQPLHRFENQSKSDTFMPHMFFNHLITLMRFLKYKSLNIEYQGVVERLHWLREKLRYGENLKDDKLNNTFNFEMGNQQPRLVN